MRSVIFDLGGVVLRWNVDDILQGFYDDAELRAIAKREIFLHADWLEMDRGGLDEQQAAERFHARTRRPLDEMKALVRASQESLAPIDGTVELLHELARAGVPLYCLSNMPSATYVNLRRQHAFFDLFRGIVISGDIKLVKPDPLIFEHITQRYRLRPGDTVFVDDREDNVRGAADFGFRAVLFRSPEQCRRDLAAVMGGVRGKPAG